MPSIDESRWPVVVATMPHQALSDQEFAVFFGQLAAYWRRGQRFGLVVDVRAAPPLSPPQRRLVAEHLDRETEAHPDRLFGVAVILSNTIQRGIVSVLTWLMRKPFDIRPFPSVELGAAWILDGVKLPFKPSKTPKSAAAGR